MTGPEQPDHASGEPPRTAETSGDALGSSNVIFGPRSAGNSQEWIGRYRILDRLGEGGMGVVYLAEQTEPIHRRVALKIIKPGMDSDAVVARFEAERQALERMDHPNIATILDAGVTERGLPYFVMEFVKGAPITEHADRERLDVEERLELFIQVCEAVQHAHHKGIIHRDLKPSNVLVAWEGDRAVPKVIDFGVARATDTGSEVAFTRHGQLIGTPEYMSPEQAEMSTQDIDTRTDVYSLGVMLYELLTGTLPFESPELRQAGLDAVRRIIREVDPPLPSRRIRDLPTEGATTLGTVSKARRTDSKRLARLLRNDLDWVIMKCLEKRRDRRYATPSALALDLRRFLSGETVLTGPPSLGYHAAKFVRRHRAGVTTASLVGVALVAGLVASIFLWQRAEASEARSRALAIALINEFHDSVAPLPGALRARQRFVELGTSYLDRALQHASDDDLVLDVADAYDKLGDVQGGLRTPHLGDLDAAMDHYDTARALRRQVESSRPGDPRVIIALARSALNEGDIHRTRDQNAEAARAYRTGMSLLDAVHTSARESSAWGIERAMLLVALANTLGRDPATAASPERANLLNEAEVVTRKLMGAGVDEPTLEARARAVNNLADYLRETGRPAEAIAHLEESARIRLQLFEADPIDASRRRDLASTHLTLGRTLAKLGRTDEGRDHFTRCLEHFQFLSDADPTDAEARTRLAQVYETLASVEPDDEARVRSLEIAVALSQRTLRDAPSATLRENIALQQESLAFRLAKLNRLQESNAAGDGAFAQYDALREQGAASITHLPRLVRTAQIRTVALQGLTKASPERTHEALWSDLQSDIDRVISWTATTESSSSSTEAIATLERFRDICRAAQDRDARETP